MPYPSKFASLWDVELYISQKLLFKEVYTAYFKAIIANF